MDADPFQKTKFFKDSQTELRLITEFQPWQQNIINFILEKPNKKIINWVFDPIENNEQIKFLKYVCHNHRVEISRETENAFKYAKNIVKLLKPIKNTNDISSFFNG